MVYNVIAIHSNCQCRFTNDVVWNASCTDFEFGIAESRILSYYGVANRVWLILLANYVSMITGMQYIAPHFSTKYGNSDFWGGQTSYGNYELDGFMMGMLISFLATLVIELPFAFLSVKDKEKRQSLLQPYILADVATNTEIFVLYFWIVIGGSK